MKSELDLREIEADNPKARSLFVIIITAIIIRVARDCGSYIFVQSCLHK